MCSGQEGDGGRVVENKQVVAKDYVARIPKETDLYVRSGKVGLKVAEGSDSLLVKKLYLSCDPYMRGIKLMGCYVVGSAGTPKKVELLKTKFGFDEAFNYEEESNYDVALKRYFPKGIDIYFDNVGGKMLDEVLLNMRLHGRIAVAGIISQYSLDQPDGIMNLMRIVFNQIRIQGFIVFNYYHLYLLET